MLFPRFTRRRCRPFAGKGQRWRPWMDRLEARALLAAWVELGPAPTLGGQTEGLVGNGTVSNPDNAVVGAVEALATDPTNANVVYAGSANSGIWKTINAMSLSPTWTPLTDGLPSTSIGAVAISPLASSTVYAGSGLFSSFSDGIGGRGLYKSTDSGVTWAVSNPGGMFTGQNIKSVVPTTLTTLQGQVVLLATTNATTGGIFRSTDGGATFTRISGNGTSGLPAAGATHLVPDPGVPNRFYAGLPNLGVYRSDDGGVTWAAKVNGLTGFAAANSRVELAVHNDPTNDVVYAALLQSGRPTGFFRSTNQGDTWTAMDLAGTNESSGFQGTNPGADGEDDDEDGDPTNDLPVEDSSADDPGGQGAIHFALLADQTNPFVVFVSGDIQPHPPFPNSIGSNDYSGRILRGDASQPSGQQWLPVTNKLADPDGTGPLPGTSPHADSRDMIFDANGNILQGNDGGVYRLINPNASGTAAGRQWGSFNGNLRTTEFHSIGYSHLTHTALGGAQDTGTPSQLTATSTVWRDISTADGGNVQVDDTSTANRSTRYTSLQNFGGFTRTTYDATNTVTARASVALVVNGTGGQTLSTYDTTIQFYQPFELDAVNPVRMVIGTSRLYESTNRGDALNVLTITLANGSTTTQPGTINAMAYGGSYRGVANPDVLYAGGNGGVYARTTAGGAVQQLASYPGGTPRDITLDPQNWRHVYVLDTSGRIYASLNAGATWTNVTGNLASQLPAGGAITSMRTITFVGNTSNYDATSVAIGGYGGVYAIPHPGLAGSALSWAPVGTGLPNTLSYDLRYDATDDVLILGTLGRGAWLLRGVSGLGATPAPAPSLAAPAPAGAPPGTPVPGADPIAPASAPGRRAVTPGPLDTTTIGPAADLTLGASVDLPLITDLDPSSAIPSGPLALIKQSSKRPTN